MFDDGRSGSRVKVIGTTTSEWDPSLYVCLIDNTNIPNGDLPNLTENNIMFCGSDSLSDGQHTITLQTTVQVGDSLTFWFDKLQYLPSSTMSLHSSFIVLNANDPAIHYSYAWQDVKDDGMTANQQGEKMTLDFNGVYFSN